MTYGVTIQTLDRVGGNRITVLFVDAPAPDTARAQALTIAEQRYGCAVIVGTACAVAVRPPTEE